MNLLALRREITSIREQMPEAEVIGAVLKLLKDRYEEFDDGARREADRILDGMLQIGAANARRQVGTMEDGAEKRALARGIARSERTHVTAHDLVATLEGKTSQTAAVVSACAGPFVSALQTCADFLYEARREKTPNKQHVVLHGLFIGVIDELLVAFHLAQRAFSSQAYAHLRTVEEVLDAIDVLIADAALLERWLDATAPEAEREVFREVRQRVGTTVATPDSRKLYAFLSALGPHSQFRSVQSRALLSEDEDGDRTATYYFLGTPMQLEAANVLTVREAVATAVHISRAFSTVLLSDDVSRELGPRRTEIASLVKDHLVPVAEQMQLTAAEVEAVLAHRLGSL